MKEAYIELHKLGLAKSVEIWQNDELVGGFYGIDQGNIFCGESMFSKVSNASKAGFIWFVEKYKNKYELIDCQVHSNHLESLGAENIPAKEFLNFLNKLLRKFNKKKLLKKLKLILKTFVFLFFRPAGFRTPTT